MEERAEGLNVDKVAALLSWIWGRGGLSIDFIFQLSTFDFCCLAK